MAFYDVILLLQVLRYTTSWTARPNHHSLLSAPPHVLPPMPSLCLPFLQSLLPHRQGFKGHLDEDVAESEVWVQRTKVSQKWVWPLEKLAMWWMWTLSVETWRWYFVNQDSWQYIYCMWLKSCWDGIIQHFKWVHVTVHKNNYEKNLLFLRECTFGSMLSKLALQTPNRPFNLKNS